MYHRQPLTYPSLRVVFGQFDLNKRIQLVNKIATLKNLNKVLPKSVKVLKIGQWKIVIDNCLYYFKLAENSKNSSMEFSNMPIPPSIWDPEMFSWSKSPLEHYVTVMVPGTAYSAVSNAMRYFLSNMFCGKHLTNIRMLYIDDFSIWNRIPNQLNVQIQQLRVWDSSDDVLKILKPTLKSSWLPLEDLTIRVENPFDTVFQNPDLLESKVVNFFALKASCYVWAGVLNTLPNLKIHFCNELTLGDIISLIQYRVQNLASIGTKFSMETENVESFLSKLQLSFYGSQQCSLPSRHSPRFPQALNVLISGISELNIYGFDSPDYVKEIGRSSRSDMLVLEVMEKGSAVIIDESH